MDEVQRGRDAALSLEMIWTDAARHPSHVQLLDAASTLTLFLSPVTLVPRRESKRRSFITAPDNRVSGVVSRKEGKVDLTRSIKY